MAKGNQTKKQHVSMRGKVVDMDLLRKRNELTPAVGNARVNARGDELGPGGKIIRKADDRVREHYQVAGKVRSASGRAKPKADEVVATPEETVVVTEELTQDEIEMLAEEAAEEEWVEDADGNFVPKSEA